jgi:glucose-6-phosphate-specific signal transduction histidine kinase
MYASVFAASLWLRDASDTVLMLLIFPISLLALTFGTRVGSIAGLVAAGLVLAWTWIVGVDLSLVGWVSRVGTMLFLGVLIGDAADRLVRAEEERQALEISQLRHRQTAEVTDSLIQGMAAAKWSLESGRVDIAVRTLEETIASGQHTVSATLRTPAPTTPSPVDRAAS